MSSIKGLLSAMWKDYIEMTPQAVTIVELLKARGDTVVNDHIALRTFNHEKTTIAKLAAPFLAAGYAEGGEYHFEQKKLYAKHFEHPDKELPKVFISELLLEKFSPDFQEKCLNVIQKIDAATIAGERFLVSGRTWDIASSDYDFLARESEYAAWLAAIGFRPNHFTVSVNELQSFQEVQELNEFLKEKGYKLNSSGGEVKGTPSDYLEQSSTLADEIEVEFTDGKRVIPSCYFEFAKRYALKSGELYQGFVAKSADKIFESTNRKED